MKEKGSPHNDGRRLSAGTRGYGGRWRQARITYLVSHPLCTMCLKLGRTTAASVVDHIEPHRGDQKLFWDRENWQALCPPCHNSVKQTQEKSGVLIGCDVDGMPLDANHFWNHGRTTTNTDGDEDHDRATGPTRDQ